MVFKGFRFGMLLQFAVGPVCIFIFQVSVLKGFYAAEAGVLGAVIVDGLFIMAAISGMARIIEKEKVKTSLKFFGSVILLIFGFCTVLCVFDIDILPVLSLQNISHSDNVFLQTVFLTISNPLTVIFWAGVFSTKIIEENLKKKDLYPFGLGALLSTLISLSVVSLAGSFTKSFLSSGVIDALNLAVGLLLIYFGIRLLLKKL